MASSRGHLPLLEVERVGRLIWLSDARDFQGGCRQAPGGLALTPVAGPGAGGRAWASSVPRVPCATCPMHGGGQQPSTGASRACCGCAPESPWAARGRSGGSRSSVSCWLPVVNLDPRAARAPEHQGDCQRRSHAQGRHRRVQCAGGPGDHCRGLREPRRLLGSSRGGKIRDEVDVGWLGTHLPPARVRRRRLHPRVGDEPHHVTDEDERRRYELRLLHGVGKVA